MSARYIAWLKGRGGRTSIAVGRTIDETIDGARACLAQCNEAFMPPRPWRVEITTYGAQRLIASMLPKG